MNIPPSAIQRESARTGVSYSVALRRLEQRRLEQRTRVFSALCRMFLNVDTHDPMVDRSEQCIDLPGSEFSRLHRLLRGDPIPPSSVRCQVRLSACLDDTVEVRFFCREGRLDRLYRRRV